MSTLKRYSYSLHREGNFYDDYESRAAAAEAAREEMLRSGPEGVVFWTGRNRKPDPLAAIHGQDLIERIIESDDFLIEQAEDWPDASREQVDDLTIMLRYAFRRWMEKHNLKPDFWLIEDIQEHLVVR